MKRTILKSLLLCGLFASLISLPVMVIANEDGDPELPPAVPDQQLVDIFADLGDISMSLNDEGKLSFAGVIAVGKDDVGHTTVELKRSGDFDLDSVLIVNLPLRTDSEGEVVVGGLSKITFLPETVVITIENQAGGQAAMTPEDDCGMGIKFPSMVPTCVGGCPDPSATCSFTIRYVARDLCNLSQVERKPLENLFGDSMPEGAALIVPVEVVIICDCLDLDP